jgi:hypothetical protein
MKFIVKRKVESCLFLKESIMNIQKQTMTMIMIDLYNDPSINSPVRVPSKVVNLTRFGNLTV